MDDYFEKENTFEKVYRIVRSIPCGQVTTYGQIAKMLGNPRLSRAVGYALNGCSDQDVPCHRVVNRLGELSRAFAVSGVNEQRWLLEEEGVPFTTKGTVALSECMWYGSDEATEK